MNPVPSFETWIMRGLVLALLGLVSALAAHIWNSHRTEDKRRLDRHDTEIKALQAQEASTGKVIVRLETTLGVLSTQFGELRASVDRLVALFAGNPSFQRRKADLLGTDDE